MFSPCGVFAPSTGYILQLPFHASTSKNPLKIMSSHFDISFPEVYEVLKKRMKSSKLNILVCLLSKRPEALLFFNRKKKSSIHSIYWELLFHTDYKKNSTRCSQSWAACCALKVISSQGWLYSSPIKHVARPLKCTNNCFPCI